jgi:hypothetical protein
MRVNGSLSQTKEMNNASTQINSKRQSKQAQQQSARLHSHGRGNPDPRGSQGRPCLARRAQPIHQPLMQFTIPIEVEVAMLGTDDRAWLGFADTRRVPGSIPQGRACRT